MATATATDQGSTGVLVPLLAAAANLVANDPDRPAGAEAVTQIRETFTEFIGIVGEGEQMMVIQQDRSRRASEWEDTEDCDLYTGTCLGSYRERSDGGGSVTRIAVWVRAFDKERLCAPIRTPSTRTACCISVGSRAPVLRSRVRWSSTRPVG